MGSNASLNCSGFYDAHMGPGLDPIIDSRFIVAREAQWLGAATCAESAD
jgi:hypothetical protein